MDASPGILVTQLVWLHPGREAEFEAFEAAVLPLLAKYGGEFLLRAKPHKDGGDIDVPDEIHVVRFDNEEALARFTADDARRALLPQKEAAVRKSVLVSG